MSLPDSVRLVFWAVVIAGALWWLLEADVRLFLRRRQAPPVVRDLRLVVSNRERKAS